MSTLTENINTVGWPAELMQNHVIECHAEIKRLKAALPSGAQDDSGTTVTTLHTTTPRTDAACGKPTKDWEAVSVRLCDCSIKLETELQQAQSALAAVTLERDEAISEQWALTERLEMAAKQLADCQSREAKALLMAVKAERERDEWQKAAPDSAKEGVADYLGTVPTEETP